MVDINKQLNNFLLSKVDKVLVLKGDWGVGKTYFWNKFYTDEIKSGKAKKIKYDFVYVSLFGVSAIEQLKSLIFFAHNFSGEDQEFAELSEGIINDEQKIIGLVLGQLRDKGLDNLTIVIDDVERAGDELDIKKLFGFMDHWVNTKNIKFIIIYNEKQINITDGKGFLNYKEKIVNREIEFNITPSQAADIVFKGHSYKAEIQERCEILKLNNLRVLFRIKDFFEELLNQLKRTELSDELKKDFLHNLIIVCWSNYLYTTDDTIPNIELLRDAYTSDMELMIGQKNEAEEELPEEIKTQRKIVKAYGFTPEDEFYEPIKEFVITGRPNIDAIKAAILNRGEYLKKAALREQFRNAWLHITGGFKEGVEKDFIKDMVAAAKKRIEVGDMTIPQLDSACRTLKRLGYEDYASLIDEFENTYVEQDRLRNCVRDFLTSSVRYIVSLGEIDSLIRKYSHELQDERSIEEVIGNIVEKGKLSKRDKNQLLVLGRDAIRDYLEQQHKNNLVHEFISTIKSEIRVLHYDKDLVFLMKDVLRSLADKSELNKIRVEASGI